MPDVQTEIHEASGGHVSLKLRGALDSQTTAVCWRELEKALHPKRVTSLEVDASEVKLAGGIGAALLRYLSEGGMTPNARVEVRGLSKEAQTILDTFTAEDYRAYRPKRPARPSVPAEIGAFLRGLWQDLIEQITFLGSLIAVVPQVVRHPKRLRWREVRCIMERAGANALPVISFVNVLAGMVMVLEAAHPLQKFGAQIFLADMIGLASLRDTGPVVTAVLVAGRSGSGFAAELGAMKVNQELDALTTMGLHPIRFLVIQRVLAALLLMPLLTLYAMLMGILGGMFVMRTFGFPPLMIYHQMLNRVGLGDLAVGLTKSAIFGLLIGAMACLRGLQTGRGPSAVGASATRSVIACIILIILADSIYAGIDYFWK
jgi:phospholipid/cholesterol/gamma-HCH transport system permease protein